MNGVSKPALPLKVVTNDNVNMAHTSTLNIYFLIKKVVNIEAVPSGLVI